VGKDAGGEEGGGGNIWGKKNLKGEKVFSLLDNKHYNRKKIAPEYYGGCEHTSQKGGKSNLHPGPKKKVMYHPGCHTGFRQREKKS